MQFVVNLHASASPTVLTELRFHTKFLFHSFVRVFPVVRCPSPNPSPGGEGDTPSPHPTGASIVAPTLLTQLKNTSRASAPAPYSCIKWQSLCFILRLRFSNDVCSAADSWKTKNSDKKLVQICLYCLKCTEFGQLVLAKIIKIVATRCHILRLKCTKFDVGCGSAPDPAGELTALPQTP